MTTGISVLKNFMRTYNVPADGLSGRFKTIKQFLFDSPTTASAELNALLTFRPDLKDVGVKIVYTASEDGKLVYELLSAWFKKMDVPFSSLQLKDLDCPSNKHGDMEYCQALAEASLDSFEQELYALISGLPKPIFLNATGGFKSEIAVAYVVARKLNVPVYYMHESYRTTICLPYA